MDIKFAQGNQRLHFQVSGDIDEMGAAELKRQFEQCSLNGIEEVTFNFREVTYIGSAGLGKLLLFYKKLSSQDIPMRIENPSPMAADIVRELKLDSLFAIV